MNPKSIRTHLAPYKILAKRRTTIAHAFASALAPTDEFSEEVVTQALIALGQQDMQHLTCVYCGKAARTWDHLVNLVKDGKLNGYGHQIGNLVPCCRDCNSAKGSLPFANYVRGLAHLDKTKQENLVQKLEQHLKLARSINQEAHDSEAKDTLERFNALKTQIFELMSHADACAAKLRDVDS